MKTKTPMTDEEKSAAVALHGCRFLPGSWDKKFSKSVYLTYGQDQQITDNQREHLWRLILRYRRQIKDVELVYKAQQFIDEISLF